MPEEPDYITKCRDLIEEKLGWGKSTAWQNQDFDKLSEKIFAETKVLLSSSTLKRIWGKVKYKSSPNLSTLNVLAQFAGYENWRAFTATGWITTEEKTNSIVTAQRKGIPQKYFFIAGLLLLFIFIAFWSFKKQPRHLGFEKLSFTSKPVTLGLPNTVIFQYDASHSNADSVFIQQSWDSRRRFRVDKQLHEYTSTYYYPGYYRAKLILDDSVVKEHDVYIETEGWVGIIEKSLVPVYLPKTLFQNQLVLNISEKELLDQKIDFQKEPPVVSLIKVDKTINTPSEHMALTVQLQNTYDKSNGICRQTSIRLFGTTGVIDIPLCNIGCVGEIGLMIGMQYINGKTKDLSGFGVDFSNEATVHCKTGNGAISISINNKMVYHGDFKQGVGRIVGAKITFRGTGIVRGFDLKEGG